MPTRPPITTRQSCRPVPAAARQSESRGSGADRRALAFGPLTPSPLLQPGRTQRGNRRVSASAQRRASDPSAWRHPPGATRGTRPAASQGLAKRALCLCRMAAAPGRYHVEVEAHFYSVPYRIARREVEVRLTPRTVEVFRASGSPRTCAPVAITSTPPFPITCHRAISAMPTGPSSVFAARPPRSVGRRQPNAS